VRVFFLFFPLLGMVQVWQIGWYESVLWKMISDLRIGADWLWPALNYSVHIQCSGRGPQTDGKSTRSSTIHSLPFSWSTIRHRTRT
jgi:hypothetical protein